jgi:glycosyltransferase involved in cell wall biosynthesis
VLHNSRQFVELGVMSDGEVKSQPATNHGDPLERALAHADLGLPLPRRTRFRFPKRVLARVGRLFTSHQVEVNRGLVEAVSRLRTALAQAEGRRGAATDRLADEIAALRTELSDLQVALLEARSDGANDEQSGAAQDEMSQVSDPVKSSGPVPGVNAIGDFAAGTGLVEATRRLVQTVASAGIEVVVTDFDLPVPKSPLRTVREVDELPRGRSHEIELWCINVNEFRLVDDSVLRPPGMRPRHVIGLWFWEAASLPAWARIELDRVDEIWVPSRFARDAFRTTTGKPIVVLPCVVDAPPPPACQRSDYGLPEDAVLFFFNFDSNSSDARKNPWGVIRAYRDAFTDQERHGPVRLVLKTQNLDAHPQLRAALEQELDAVNAILLDGELPREVMNGLLGSIDVYASLHRGEGFGLGIAEAMYLGKPVIVTAYSGNMDYTTRTNSCLVGYTLRPVEASDHDMSPHAKGVYEPGLTWAEPNVNQAARWMRYLYDHPNERARIGRAGAITIRKQFSPRAIAHIITSRLAEIARARSCHSQPPESACARRLRLEVSRDTGR